MEDLKNQLAAITTALQTATNAVEAAVNDINNTAATPADNILASVVSSVTTEGLVQVFGSQPLVDALNAEGYTVTPPEPAAPAA